MKQKKSRVSKFVFICASLFSTVAWGQGSTYNEALRLNKNGDFVNAARLFYQLHVSSTGDTKLKSEFGLADSLRRLGLEYSAAFFFSRIVAQGPKSDFFQLSLQALSQINAKTPLGRASISGLFANKIDPLQVPEKARGFYFFYRGVEVFESGKNQSSNSNNTVLQAKAEFDRVPADSPYFAQAQYYLGVISSVTKDSDAALTHFNRVAKSASSDVMKQLAIMNIGRSFYEKKDFKKAFQYYSQIDRDSDLWLQSIFEGAWAFFMIQKHNNSLGNVHTLHSPFFVNRFFPESYILNAITYLRLCRFNALKQQLQRFQERYKPTFVDLKGLLSKYNNQPAAFFSVIGRYNSTNQMKEFTAATEVIDSVSRSDAFRESKSVVNGLDTELQELRKYGAKWELSGLADVLRTSFDQRKSETTARAGEDLFAQAVQQYRYLRDLSDQTRLINLEMLSGKTDELRSKFNSESIVNDGTQWGEGMKPLNLKQQLEYWPFEGEYWEDELGGYVYNIDSSCNVAKNQNSKDAKGAGK
jgi:tetratricopeptide (TPR) repeat protein